MPEVFSGIFICIYNFFQDRYILYL